LIARGKLEVAPRFESVESAFSGGVQQWPATFRSLIAEDSAVWNRASIPTVGPVPRELDGLRMEHQFSRLPVYRRKQRARIELAVTRDDQPVAVGLGRDPRMGGNLVVVHPAMPAHPNEFCVSRKQNRAARRFWCASRGPHFSTCPYGLGRGGKQAGAFSCTFQNRSEHGLCWAN
jgi:hypothetical protein